MRRWILVTREPDNLVELADRMRERDVDVIAFPTLTEVPAAMPSDVATLRDDAASIRWIAVTSPRASLPLATTLAESGLAESQREWPVAALGEASATAARAAGFRVALVGDGTARGLGAALAPLVPPGGKVLFACGREHREELLNVLASAGIAVVVLPVYAMNLTPIADLPNLPDAPPMAVVLSSPRATEGYVRACGHRFAEVRHVAFGPTTAEAAARLGITASVLDQPTVPCIVEVICQTS